MIWFPDWLNEGHIAAFDTETTGIDVSTARIVQATVVELSASGFVGEKSWLVNPGIPIPPEATAVHGITDAVAETGVPAPDAVHEIIEQIVDVWARKLPLVIVNAPYDLSLLAHEALRYGLPFPDVGPVLDPLCIDRGIDKYRKGGRKLEDLAKHYGVALHEAHNSRDDALCGASVLWMIGQRHRGIKALSIDDMQAWQRRKFAEWAINFQEYKRQTDPNAVIDAAWPIREGIERIPF